MGLQLVPHQHLVRVNFGQTLLQTVIGNERVPENSPLVPKNSGIRKVSLLSTHRQLVPEVVCQGVSYS